MCGGERFFASTQLIPFAPLSYPSHSSHKSHCLLCPIRLIHPISPISPICPMRPNTQMKTEFSCSVSICVYRQGTYFFKGNISSCVKLLPGNHGLVMGNKVDGVRSDTNKPQRLCRLVGANIARHYANLMLVE